MVRGNLGKCGVRIGHRTPERTRCATTLAPFLSPPQKLAPPFIHPLLPPPWIPPTPSKVRQSSLLLTPSPTDRPPTPEHSTSETTMSKKDPSHKTARALRPGSNDATEPRPIPSHIRRQPGSRPRNDTCPFPVKKIFFHFSNNMVMEQRFLLQLNRLAHAKDCPFHTRVIL